VSEVSLWLDEPYAPQPALAGDTACAVCVVGAGIGGLAVAWHLVARGIRDVVVVDRRVVNVGLARQVQEPLRRAAVLGARPPAPHDALAQFLDGQHGIPPPV
jgi:shikimate 5-dehydrogenase